jgi:hypothetical protein
MAWRLRHHDKLCRGIGLIQYLMSLFRWNLQSLLRAEEMAFSLNLYGESPREDEEELARARVAVPGLRSTGRHLFLDHAQVRRLHQMPAIAPFPPGVMLGIALGDHVIPSLKSSGGIPAMTRAIDAVSLRAGMITPTE